jgi:hypothetical protein
MVGQQPLKLFILVRIQVPEQIKNISKRLIFFILTFVLGSGKI